MMEEERKNRGGCSENLDFINRKYNSRARDKIPPEEREKYGKTRTSYEDRLKKIFKGTDSKNEPKNEGKVEPKILRWIKEIELNLDKSWKNDEGMHGVVEKYNMVYKISEDESINAESNQEMAKVREMNKKKSEVGSSPMFFEETTQKEDEVIISSILVKKTPINESSKSFDIERKLLAYLRGERCYAINCYYSVEMENIESMQYFYSDFHNKKITDYSTTKLKNYFKVFTFLCEGLLFLRWSGVSHRDLKPDNILLSKNNLPKIIDFGSGCHNRFFHSSLNQHNNLKVINKERNNFLTVVQTNERYNLRYSVLPKKVSEDLTREQYEQHPHFDMFAFGSLMDELLGGAEVKLEMGELESEYCKFIVDSCKEPNPIDRPDPKDLYTLIVSILKNRA